MTGVGVGGAGVVVLVDWVVVDFSVVLVDSVVVFSVVVLVVVVLVLVLVEVVEVDSVLVVFLCLSGITSVVVGGSSGAAAASTLSTSAAARMTDTEPVMKIIINQREVQQGKVKRIHCQRREFDMGQNKICISSDFCLSSYY